MEWKQCKVVTPFVCFIDDMFGNNIVISLNRGRKFDYRLEDNKLILSSKGLKLTIPKGEFSKFTDI